MKKILIVEDNPKLARALVQALSEEGYEVEHAPDGESGLQRALAARFDVVILDWMLPGMDGIQVCRALRERQPAVPILILTARSELSDRVAGLDAGADDYLAKPFELQELFARIRALARRAAAGESVLLRVGPISIDRAARRVQVDGRRVDFTPREFDLLVCLARQAGRDVPRKEILQQVWELSFDPGTNVVDVHVRKLREKLSPHGGMIEAVRGVGYRLVPPDA